MTIKRKNEGFAILEILLLLVTLTFIGAIAWVVSHHAKDAQYKAVIKTNQGNYIEIPEWHVKLTIPDLSQKITYDLVNKEQPNDIVVSSEALNKFATDHKECNAANQFVFISRVKEGETWHGLPWPQAKEELIKKGSSNLGLYYYYDGTRPSISPCLGSNIAEIQKLNNEAYDLYDKLPTYKNVVINP